MFDWSPCLSMIGESHTVAVLPHISADGDALGAAFSLGMALTEQGKEVAVILEEAPEKRLTFLLPPTGPKTLLAPEGCDDPYDLAIAVDCADRFRLGVRQEVFFRSPRQIKIDHHIEKDPYGQINFVDSRWAATCEGIWSLLCEAPFDLRGRLQAGTAAEDPFARHLATCLYCGVASDTGSFSYANTTEETHEIAGALVAFLGEISDLHFRLFDSSTPAAIALRATAYGKICYEAGGAAAFLELTEADFTESGAVYDDANDLVAAMRGIEGVELAVFARPNRNGGGGCKVSLRSNRCFDAAAMAAVFGGGGHKRAAGFDYSGDFSRVKAIILDRFSRETESDGSYGRDN